MVVGVDVPDDMWGILRFGTGPNSYSGDFFAVPAEGEANPSAWVAKERKKTGDNEQAGKVVTSVVLRNTRNAVCDSLRQHLGKQFQNAVVTTDLGAGVQVNVQLRRLTYVHQGANEYVEAQLAASPKNTTGSITGDFRTEPSHVSFVHLIWAVPLAATIVGLGPDIVILDFLSAKHAEGAFRKSIDGAAAQLATRLGVENGIEASTSPGGKSLSADSIPGQRDQQKP
jgi:hypothetical protein